MTVSHYSALRIVTYFWCVSFTLIGLLYFIKTTFGWENILGFDFFIIVFAPYIVSIFYKKKLGLPISEDKANKVAKYFIISFLAVFYILILFFILSLSDDARAKLSESTTFIVILFSIMSLAIYFFGRWVIVMHLTHKK